jgi:hypothetical protein
MEAFDKSILTEEETLDVEKITDVIKKHGGDPEDKETALNFFDELIDSDLNLNSIKIEDVIESKKKDDDLITEVSGTLTVIKNAFTTAQSYLGKTEKAGVILEFLSKVLKSVDIKVTPEKIAEGLKKLGKILDIIPDQLSKLIFKTFRYFGTGLEKSSVASIGGEVIWLIILGVISVSLFPSIGSILSGGLGIWKLIALIPKVWSILKNIGSIIKNFIKGTKEIQDKIYTPIDFLSDFEKLTNGKISYELKNGFEEWYDGVTNPKKMGWEGNYKFYKSLTSFVGGSTLKLLNTFVDIGAESYKKIKNKEKLNNNKLIIGKLFEEVLTKLKNGRETKAGELLKKMGVPEKTLKGLRELIHSNPKKT